MISQIVLFRLRNLSIYKVFTFTAVILASTETLQVPMLSAQELSKNAVELIKALNEAKDAHEELEKLRGAADNALHGKPISTGSDWSKLADRYDKLTEAARKSPLPSQFTSANIVSVGDFSNCATRPASIQKLNAYLQDLKDASAKGKTVVASLDATLTKDIPSTRESLVYLIKVHEDLMALPGIGSQFAFDWLDLNTRVLQSLGQLESALKGQKKRYNDNVILLDQEIGNYESNLSKLSQMTCSPITGTWSGTGSNSSVQFGGGRDCRYQATMQNLQLQATVDANGRVTAASLSGVMVESLVGGCPHPPLGTRGHSYFGGGTTSSSQINLNLNPAAGNGPKCIATFSRAVVSGRLRGTLTIRRTDIAPPLAWQTQHQVQ
ncbi:hypothetical protein [Nitrospira sp. Nam74]